MGNFVDRKDFYRYNQPDMIEQTKSRLLQLQEMGMKEVGVAQFGLEGVMSGLYIERVWNYTNKEWDEYIDWINSLIVNKK